MCSFDTFPSKRGSVSLSIVDQTGRCTGCGKKVKLQKLLPLKVFRFFLRNRFEFQFEILQIYL